MRNSRMAKIINILKEINQKINALDTICAMTSDNVKLLYNVLRYFHGLENWDKAATEYETILKEVFEKKKAEEEKRKSMLKPVRGKTGNGLSGIGSDQGNH